jgi:hypothetical protein
MHESLFLEFAVVWIPTLTQFIFGLKIYIYTWNEGYNRYISGKITVVMMLPIMFGLSLEAERMAFNLATFLVLYRPTHFGMVVAGIDGSFTSNISNLMGFKLSSLILPNSLWYFKKCVEK